MPFKYLNAYYSKRQIHFSQFFLKTVIEEYKLMKCAYLNIFKYDLEIPPTIKQYNSDKNRNI